MQNKNTQTSGCAHNSWKAGVQRCFPLPVGQRVLEALPSCPGPGGSPPASPLTPGAALTWPLPHFAGASGLMGLAL